LPFVATIIKTRCKFQATNTLFRVSQLNRVVELVSFMLSLTLRVEVVILLLVIIWLLILVAITLTLVLWSKRVSVLLLVLI
jgi:hypothetical protein